MDVNLNGIEMSGIVRFYLFTVSPDKHMLSATLQSGVQVSSYDHCDQIQGHNLQRPLGHAKAALAAQRSSALMGVRRCSTEQVHKA